MTQTNFDSVATTVLFDGQCPLCSREIDFYRRQRGSESINWVDISTFSTHSLPSGLTREDALASFHIINTKDQLVSGGDAFSSLWLSLPAFRWAGKMFRIRFLASLLEVGYMMFLPCRPLLQRCIPIKKEPINDK